MKDTKQSIPLEIVGAIDLWVKEGLPEFAKKHMSIHACGNIFSFTTNSGFSDKRNNGEIIVMSEGVHMKGPKVMGSWRDVHTKTKTCLVEFDDPKLFDKINLFVMKVLNG